MSLYAIADLHLSTNITTNKSMDIFGPRWNGYTEKLRKNWTAVVNPSDSIILPGDISWAMTLEEAVSDFRFLDSLPGKKYIGKGNHDFWWTTAKKLTDFFETNNFKTIKILYNNACILDNCVVCGTRGWFYDEKSQNTVGEANFEKIINREAIRLEMSLKEAQAIRGDLNIPIVAFFHFPVVYGDFYCEQFINILHKYGVTECYYGHIHGNYFLPRTITFEGITFTIISADYLNFSPMPIFPGDNW